MKEFFLSNELSIIELSRNNVFEYYITSENNANLYFVFGVKESFSAVGIINLYCDGYFDNIIAENNL